MPPDEKVELVKGIELSSGAGNPDLHYRKTLHRPDIWRKRYRVDPSDTPATVGVRGCNAMRRRS